MSQELHLHRSRLLWAQPKIVRLDALHSEIGEGSPLGSRMHQQVIQVYHALGEGDWVQDTFHQALKSGWAVTEAKWHDCELLQSSVNGKCSLVQGLLLQLHLPVSASQVQRAELPG